MELSPKVEPIFNLDKPEKGLLKRRTYAFTLDLFAIALINKALLLTYSNFLQTFFYQLPIHSQQNIISQLPKAGILTLSIVFFTYFFLSYYLGEGKTPGKLFFGLRVFSSKTLAENLSAKESFLRSLGYMICYGTGMFLFSIPFMRRDRKGLPDWFSNTETISEQRFILLQNLEKEPKDSKDTEQLDLFDEAA